MNNIVQKLDEKGLLFIGDRNLRTPIEYHNVFGDLLKAIGRATQNSIRISWRFAKRLFGVVRRALTENTDAYNQAWARRELSNHYSHIHFIR